MKIQDQLLENSRICISKFGLRFGFQVQKYFYACFQWAKYVIEKVNDRQLIFFILWGMMHSSRRINVLIFQNIIRTSFVTTLYSFRNPVSRSRIKTSLILELE